MEKEHNMAGTVAIGIQQFNEIRKKGYFYIDKTAFIREWWEKGRQCHIDHTTKEIWKNIDHEYGRAVLFS